MRWENFSLKCVLINFDISNLSLINFCISDILKLAYKPGFGLNYPFEFVGLCCEIHIGYFVGKEMVIKASIIFKSDLGIKTDFEI